MFNTKLFAERLKNARAEKHISQAELAKAVGVSAATISSYETLNGTKIPSLDKASAVAKALGISLDWVCGADETNKMEITDFSLDTYLRSLVVVLTDVSTDFAKTFDFQTGEITIHNPKTIKFLKQCRDLLDSYRNGLLTKEMYESCVECAIREVTKEGDNNDTE